MPQTVRNWIDAGTLPAVRIGPRRVRVKSSDLDRLIENGYTARAAEVSGSSEPELADLVGTPEHWERFAAAASGLSEAVANSDRGELAAAFTEIAAVAQGLADALSVAPQD